MRFLEIVLFLNLLASCVSVLGPLDFRSFFDFKLFDCYLRNLLPRKVSDLQ